MNRTIYEQLGSGFNCEEDSGAPGGWACVHNQIGPGQYATTNDCIDASNGCKKWECDASSARKKKPVKKSKKRREIREKQNIVSVSVASSACVAVNDHTAPYNNPTDCNNNCISASWDCNGITCSDPGDGSGQYSSLSSCQSNCTPSGEAVYACTCAEFQANQGSCPSSSTWHTNKKTIIGWPTGIQATVGDHFEDYATTERIVWSTHTPTQSGQHQYLAISNPPCVYTPPTTFDCYPNNGGQCLQNWNGTGAYNGGTTAQNLAACQANCIAASWDCDYINGQHCSDPGDGSGQYSSLNSCQSACQITYECDGNGSCSDPGDGSGQYTNLTTCEDACYTGEWWCEGNTTCKKNPAHWMSSTFATKQACQANCGTATFCCDVWVCVNNYTGGKTKSVTASPATEIRERQASSKCCRPISLCTTPGQSYPWAAGNFPWHLVESSGVPPEEFNKILKEELLVEGTMAL